MSQFKNLKECIEQLEKVGYKDELGHDLEHNEAFVQLREEILRDHELSLELKESIEETMQEGCSTIIEEETLSQKEIIKQGCIDQCVDSALQDIKDAYMEGGYDKVQIATPFVDEVRKTLMKCGFDDVKITQLGKGHKTSTIVVVL